MAELHREIGRRRPFDEPSQEAFLALVRTSSLLETELGAVLRKVQLSGPTYNVLRILRGSLGPFPGDHPAGNREALAEQGESGEPGEPNKSAKSAKPGQPGPPTGSGDPGITADRPNTESAENPDRSEGSDAGAGEVTCGHITRHLISPVPDVTRLVDRLQQRGLVMRRRSAKDRRVVYVKITDAGLELLASLDEPIIEAHKAQFAHLTPSETRSLIDILAKLRDGLGKPASSSSEPSSGA